MSRFLIPDGPYATYYFFEERFFEIPTVTAQPKNINPMVNRKSAEMFANISAIRGHPLQAEKFPLSHQHHPPPIHHHHACSARRRPQAARVRLRCTECSAPLMRDNPNASCSNHCQPGVQRIMLLQTARYPFSHPCKATSTAGKWLQSV
jgi:hypothetical protein